MRFLILAGTLLLSSPVAAQDIFARRDEWQRVPDIIAALGDVSGKRIADIAAGDGYLTRHLSRAVGRTGTIIAVDISDSAIAKLRRLAATDSFANVRVVVGGETDPRLDGLVDGAVILNSYHEITAIGPMLQAIRRSLRPGGRLVLVDNQGFPDWSSKPRDFQVSHHAIDPALVEKEVKEAGFEIVRRDDRFLVDPIEQWLIIARSRDVEKPDQVKEHGRRKQQ